MTTPGIQSLEAVVVDVQEDPAYVEKMAKAGEGAVRRGNNPGMNLPPEIPAKPEGVPDKFYNATTGAVDYAALTKSYTELEKKQSQGETPEAKVAREAAAKTAADAATAKAATDAAAKVAADAARAELLKTETPEAKVIREAKEKADALAATTETPEQKTAREALANKGLDLNEFSKEWAEKGTLTDESYAKLAKGGIDKATVDAFIEGQVAVREMKRAAAFKITGTETEFNAMTAWAKTALTPAEIKVFNDATATGTAEQIALAVQGLHGRYSKENGKPPGTHVGGNTGDGNSGAQPFKSRAEQTAAINDKRYDKDEAYRSEVIRRMEVSNI